MKSRHGMMRGCDVLTEATRRLDERGIREPDRPGNTNRLARDRSGDDASPR